MHGTNHSTAAVAVLDTEAGFLPVASPFAAPVSTRRHYLVVSRLLDIVLSFLALIVAGPIILLAALAVKLTSRGPAFFHQRRAGLHRQPFTMFKLRTMYDGADDDKELFRKFNALPTGPCFKMKNDPRVTTIGRWLRRSSIDELPQFLNVLRGEMSLVGPRPLPFDEVRTDSIDQKLRFTVKPGITCLWQVSGRTEIPYDEWLALDVWYIRNRSLSLDLQILVKTVPAVLSGRGAY